MTKTELVRVIVRTMGVLLVGTGIWSMISLVGSIILLSGFAFSTSNIIPALVDSVIRVTILTIVGIYLLRDGNFISDLLDG